MQTYTRNEITNKHGQRIYMFSKRPGNTELEKCIDFLTHMCAGTSHTFYRFDTQTLSGDNISIIATGVGPNGEGGFEVFNSLGEKVGECECTWYVFPPSVQDMSDDLDDLGFSI